MQKAATEVRTTVEATVIRADGTREELGVISDSKRRLSLRERVLRRFARSTPPHVSGVLSDEKLAEANRECAIHPKDAEHAIAADAAVRAYSRVLRRFERPR